MNEEKASEQITIRITESMLKRLEAEAKAQVRPLSNYIKAILTEHLESLDRAKKIAEYKK